MAVQLHPHSLVGDGQLERLVEIVKHAPYNSVGNSCHSWCGLQDIMLDIVVT